LPLDLQFYETDSFRVGFEKRIERNDPYYEIISEGWSQALKLAFQSLPPFQIK
jgi:putative proteasome-type protease